MLRLRPSPLPPSPEILLSLSPPVLRALVATFGGVEGIAANATPHAIARAVFERRAGEAREGARVGRGPVLERGGATRDRRGGAGEARSAKRDARADGWLDMSPGDVAVLLAIEIATKGAQGVWVRGVLVPLTEKPYRLLEYLAGHRGSPRTTKEIGSYASRSESPDDAARRIRADLERRVRQALAAGGADPTTAERLIVAEGSRDTGWGPA